MTKFIGNTITLPKLATAPSSPVDGDAYYNTTDNKVYARVNGAWVDLGATGGGGNTVYYQTSAPVSANTGDIWIDSDSVLGGPIELTDSPNSASTTTAATPNAVLQSMKNYQTAAYNSTTRVGNLPNWYLTTSSNQTSGNIVFTRMIPERDFTVSDIIFVNGDTASASLTLCRFGIYTRSGTTMTLVARTASDTTIFGTTFTRHSRALNTTGGYPSTYNFTAGSEYWLAVIQVGTTMSNLLAGASAGSNYATPMGAFVYTKSSQSDLGASVTTVSVSQTRIYAEVS
jgi:hypothetical protein